MKEPQPKSDSCPRWEVLRDVINAILEERGETYQDLSRVIGKSYMQLYDWLRSEKYAPRAEVTLALLAWATKYASRHTKPKLKAIYA